MNNTDNQLDIYFGKKDTFYYVVIEDKSVARDNKLSELLGENIKLLYHNPSKPTEYIHCAKFWKDKSSALHHVKSRTNRRLVELTRDEFINSIPDKDFAGLESIDITYLKNLIRKKEEIKYKNTWYEYRKKYKAINSYIRVQDPQWWLPCKDCGLIPLVWEYDNGRSTACGCGKDEYNHHSIKAESIVSYVLRNNGSTSGFNTIELRMNWNQWVETGQDVFKDWTEKLKLKNQKIW
jgi:hypothetical protein